MYSEFILELSLKNNVYMFFMLVILNETEFVHINLVVLQSEVFSL